MAKVQYRELGMNILHIAINIAVILVIAMLFYLGFQRAYLLGEHVFTNDAVAETGNGIESDITVVSGQSAYNVGNALEKKGIILDGTAFWIQSIVYEVEISPGTYTVSSEMSSKEILKMMEAEETDADSATAVTQ